MPAPRSRRTIKIGVLVAALGLAMSFFNGSFAQSPTGPSQPSAAPIQLPGLVAHDHGDGQIHYHGVSEGQRPNKRGNKARGLLFKGLRRAHSTECGAEGYTLTTSHGAKACTHGPDEAPMGVDVREVPTTAALEASTSQSTGGGSGTALPCYGDGQSGPRVQAVYVHASDVPDRFADLAPMFPEWAARVDAVFAQSAAETGGKRHVRWVTNADCTLNVTSVKVSATGDDSLNDTISELKAQGFSRTDRKYLVWADAGRYCGIGEVRNDDSAGAGNQNNFGPSFARVDSACWGRDASVEAHELMHTLGGIQNSAPHSTGGWHCADENDRMCLADSSAVALSFPCPSAHENLFDCGHDDYFSTAAAPGSYLATHWNSANSSFLSADMPESCSITGQATTSETETSRKHKKKRHHRRQASAQDATSACVPQSVFS